MNKIRFLCFLGMMQGILPPTLSLAAGKEAQAFIRLDKFIVPVIQKRRLKGAVLAELALECDSKESKEKVELLLPKIHDRLMWDMHHLIGIVWQPDFRIDAKGLKERLLTIANKTIKPLTIKDVLVLELRQLKGRGN